MVQGAEEAFAKIVLERKLLTPEQIEECRKAQASLRAAGINWSLVLIVQEKGLLSKRQIRRILEEADETGREINIPGYEIISHLGRGGMGAVYKAKQLSLQRVVALKVLSQDATANVRFLERFQREVKIVASLRHRNIVAAFDFGTANGWYYMAMEYVEGLTVKKLVNRTGPLPEERAVRIVLDIARALKYAHEQGVVHRDIKPGNIILDSSGTAKLCDLGMAKIQAPEDGSITRIGTTLGTPYYMSPEQARGETEIDGRADIYSLGITLYYMVTGDVPFKDPSNAVVMAKHLTGELPWPREVNPKVSEDLSRVINKMAAKKKEHRYQDADELIADLTSLLEGGPLKAPMRYATHLEELPAPAPPEPPAGLGAAQASADRTAQSSAVLVFALAMAVIFLLGFTGLLLKQLSDHNNAYIRLLEDSYIEAVRTAQTNPDDAEAIVKRYEDLLERARGTKFEEPLESRLKRALDRKLTRSAGR